MYRDPAYAQIPDTLTPFLRLAVGSLGLAELRVAPNIMPKQLQGAQSFAQVAPHEYPVALLDTTVMQSGKAGVLVTNLAVHLDTPRQRIPLECLPWEPTFPRGLDEPGVLHTTQGALTLARMPTAALSTALARLLSAVAWWVRRGGRYALGQGSVAGPVGAMATRCLHVEGLAQGPAIPAASLPVAAACLPDWIAPDADEEVLCFVDETLSHDGTRAMVLTDRRLISSQDGPVVMPYAALQSVEVVKGLISVSLRLGAFGQRKELATAATPAVADALGAFLQSLLQLPPEYRRAMPAPPPTADDPTGALGRLQSLAWPDPRVSTLLELVHAAYGRGDIPLESARDLVLRGRLLHQAVRQGHARHGGACVSPMSVHDLEFSLTQMLGRPVREQPMAGGRSLEFDLRTGGGGGSMIASNVVGIALLAVVGVGWVGGGGGRSQTVQARIVETRGGAFFTLCEGSGHNLAGKEPKLYGTLCNALADAAAEALLRRTLFGWNLSPYELHRYPATALDARMGALLGGTDVGVFLRRDGLHAG